MFRRKPQPDSIQLDQATLDQLRRSGADLSRATTIRHYVYVPNEICARHAASRFADDGYHTEVRAGITTPDWLALVATRAVPSLATIASQRRYFETVAKDLGGRYDGWEAAVSS